MPPLLKSFLLQWLINVVGVFLAAHIVPAIRYDTVGALIAASVILGVLNALIRPFLILLSLPLLILSLGLFMLVINAFLLFLVGRIVGGFAVGGFMPAFLGALIISVVSWLVNGLISSDSPPPPPRSRRRRRPSGAKDEGGPVIDV